MKVGVAYTLPFHSANYLQVFVDLGAAAEGAECCPLTCRLSPKATLALHHSLQPLVERLRPMRLVRHDNTDFIGTQSIRE